VPGYDIRPGGRAAGRLTGPPPPDLGAAVRRVQRLGELGAVAPLPERAHVSLGILPQDAGDLELRLDEPGDALRGGRGLVDLPGVFHQEISNLLNRLRADPRGVPPAEVLVVGIGEDGGAERLILVVLLWMLDGNPRLERGALLAPDVVL
jgi:hypothetical protein